MAVPGQILECPVCHIDWQVKASYEKMCFNCWTGVKTGETELKLAQENKHLKAEVLRLKKRVNRLLGV